MAPPEDADETASLVAGRAPADGGPPRRSHGTTLFLWPLALLTGVLLFRHRTASDQTLGPAASGGRRDEIVFVEKEEHSLADLLPSSLAGEEACAVVPHESAERTNAVISCKFVSLRNDNPHVGLSVFVPVDASLIVVYAPGSGWCGHAYHGALSDDGTFPCDVLLARGHGCAVSYYGSEPAPSQHRAFLDAVAWTHAKFGGTSRLALFGTSSGGGLVAHTWAALGAHPGVVAAVVFSASVFVAPAAVPGCAAATCPIAWSAAAAVARSGLAEPALEDGLRLDPYAGACWAELGSFGCEAAYTNDTLAEAVALVPDVRGDEAPLYVAVGALDSCVQCCNSVSLYERATALGVSAELRVLETAGHASYWEGATELNGTADLLAPPYAWSAHKWWRDEFPDRALRFIEDAVSNTNGNDNNDLGAAPPRPAR